MIACPVLSVAVAVTVTVAGAMLDGAVMMAHVSVPTLTRQPRFDRWSAREARQRTICLAPQGWTTIGGITGRLAGSADLRLLFFARRACSMKIDVVDMDDPVLGTHRRGLARTSGSTIIEMYGMSNGVAQMVDQILRAAATGSLEVLRIWGHGWSGGQLIAAGHNAQTGVDHRSALWSHNLGVLAGHLGRLRPAFSIGARLELKGCQVASGAAGEQFLTSLARIVGVNVIAAVQTQGGAWGPGQHWNGPLVQASPNGALSSVIGLSL